LVAAPRDARRGRVTAANGAVQNVKYFPLRYAAVKVMADHRRAPRERTYKAGRIGLPGKRPVIGCLVRNLSQGGANLQLPDQHYVPDAFTLVFDSGEPSRQCQVVWRGRAHIGVKFE
jgi:hypothetical protein